jgi:hypothetical protein
MQARRNLQWKGGGGGGRSKFCRGFQANFSMFFQLGETKMCLPFIFHLEILLVRISVNSFLFYGFDNSFGLQKKTPLSLQFSTIVISFFHFTVSVTPDTNERHKITLNANISS